jgi:DNA replication protein DnaC
VDVKVALTESLTELHLPTVKRVYEEAARLAERETLSYERYLLDLVTREVRIESRRESNGCFRQSRIPAEKALANFNLKRLPPKVALLTKSLIEGDVLDRRENVLAFGNPGTGKTHLLCAISQGTDRSRPAHVLYNVSASGPAPGDR